PIANIVLPAFGAIATLVALSMNESLADERYFQGLPVGLSIGLRWAGGIALPFLISSVFGALMLGASRLLPGYLPIGPALSLSSIVGAAIVVAVAGDFVPSNRRLVAWLFAGTICVLSIRSIVLVSIALYSTGDMLGILFVGVQ